MARVLMKGSEAIAEAAIRAGCRAFFGYPITPQNQVPEYMARRMPQIEGCSFVQAESEIGAINMIYGAAGAGARVMTSSSSPGISLMQEGISYIAGAELPCLIVNVTRSGPGLGGILPSQGDYYQATRGGGHGDYRLIVLAPSSVQEAADMVADGFDLADKYRMPVMILADGMIGQMMEPVEFRESKKAEDLPEKNWAATGWDGEREQALINSLYIEPEEMTVLSDRLKARHAEIEEKEVRVQEYMTEDADYIIAAYGTVGRIARNAAKRAREKGIRVGVIRPITVWPFPYETFRKAAGKVKGILTVEMNHGQMLDDVRIGAGHQVPVEFYGTVGGFIPDPETIVEHIVKLKDKVEAQ